MSAIIFLALIAAFLFWLISVYNALVTSRNGGKNAFSQIDVQLQRRNDLIPNLVATAKAAMSHERETLDAVITARNASAAALVQAKSNPGDAAAMQKLGGAESAMAAALGRFNVTVEAYPELKANANLMQLSEEVASTENRVAFARQAFNDQVLAYNNRREVFPNHFVAGAFKFAPMAYLEIEEPAQRSVPKISFN
jgi:LemA protein